MNWIVWLRTHTEKHSVTKPICNQTLIFLKKSYRFLKILTCWMEAIGNIAPRTLYMSQMINCERFHAKVKKKLDRHLNEHEGKFAVDQVGTYSVSSQQEQNHEDNQRRMMKNNEELIELCFRPGLLTL